jgi:Flp pilus assembly protein TadG
MKPTLLKRRRTRPLTQRLRRGAVLVITALLLPVLLGVTGLVIDVGLMLVLSRRTQNAADAAAMAAAVDLLQGRSATVARATAQAYVQTHNGLSTATVTTNIPPSRGPYAGNSRFVEVIVQSPLQTVLIQVLGVNRGQTVRRLAVAGMRPIGATPGVIALNPNARPGISLGGGSSLRVNGTIIVNSEGGGLDEWGSPIGNGNSGVAMSASNNATIQANDIQVVGGVNTPSNFLNYDPSNPNSPLHTRAMPVPDPFLYLPPPMVSNGANPTVYPAVSVSGSDSVTLGPGVYPSIKISSGTVVFQPGIYIIRGGDLQVTEEKVTANGVMFYLTGSDYNVSTGWPDIADLAKAPPADGNPSFGSVTINAGLKFWGLDNTSSPFNGMLFYQRRLNTNAFSLQGNSSAGNLSGTIYTKWAQMKISGQGNYGAQFVVNDVALSGNGTVNIDYGTTTLARSNQVALVE